MWLVATAVDSADTEHSIISEGSMDSAERIGLKMEILVCSRVAVTG